MVLLRTMFPVSEDFSETVFLSEVRQWLVSSEEHYHLDVPSNWIGEGDTRFTCESEDKTAIFEYYRYEDMLAVQLWVKDGITVYENSYIFHVSRSVILCELNRYLRQMAADESYRFKMPRFLKQLFWQEYGGMDNGLLADYRAHILRKADVDLAIGIESGERMKDFLMPVVYVSALPNGTYLVDYELLAQYLTGIAHVVVEGSPYVSELVAEKVERKKACDGRVVVHMPAGGVYLFTKDSGKNLAADVAKRVRISLSSIRQDGYLGFDQVSSIFETNEIIQRNMAKRQDTTKLEEKLGDVRTRLERKEKELSDVKQDLYDARVKNGELQKCLDAKKAVDETGNSVSFVFPESEFYEGEVKDVLLKILQKEQNAMKDDANLRASRKYTVISRLLEENQLTGKADEIRAVFEANCKDGTFNSEQVRTLERLGFAISKNANRHYKIAYLGDDRYATTVSRSPSDFRSGKNLISGYMNMLFGC